LEVSNIMASVKFFLDTNALLFLSGLRGSDLQDFKNQMEASSSELSTTHVQVDEITKHVKFREPVEEKHEKKVRTYEQKITEALKSLENKGIVVQIEPTKLTVAGVSRAGHCMTASEEIGKLYDELRKQIDECQNAKGKPKLLLNIACDATIAVSSLGHDFFITTDKCLFESWLKVIGRYKMLGQQFKVPKIIYARRSPKEVAKHMLDLLS
jgi:hypothetical protein